jgi:hypothetical protein
MASDLQIKEMQGLLSKVDEKKIEESIAKPGWGEINFESGRRDIECFFMIARAIREFDVSVVPEPAFRDLYTSFSQCFNVYEKMRAFNIGIPNPKETRDSLLSEFRSALQQNSRVYLGWLALLGCEKILRSDEISTVQAAKDSVLEAEKEARASLAETLKALQSAREASGKTGVHVFAHDFEQESKNAGQSSNRWLIATGLIGSATICLALFWNFIFSSEIVGSGFQIWQIVSTKVIVILMLFSGTAWCGSMYKATRHQEAVNKHRANALRTFQAFVSATNDPAVKDAVLVETTKSIFSLAPSGFLSGRDVPPSADSKMFEIVRTVSATAPRP